MKKRYRTAGLLIELPHDFALRSRSKPAEERTALDSRVHAIEKSTNVPSSSKGGSQDRYESYPVVSFVVGKAGDLFKTCSEFSTSTVGGRPPLPLRFPDKSHSTTLVNVTRSDTQQPSSPVFKTFSYCGCSTLGHESVWNTRQVVGKKAHCFYGPVSGHEDLA